jgi:hypothetical protein
MATQKVIAFVDRCLSLGLIDDAEAAELERRLTDADVPDEPDGTEHQITGADLAAAADRLRDLGF